jgi:hypothetical protein
MKNAACVLALAISVACTGPVCAMGPAYRTAQGADVGERPEPEVGMAFLAMATNLVYVPVRLAVTVVTAEVGGILGFVNGGDVQSAHALWNVTDGPGVVRPGMLDGREPFRFGPWVSH